MKKGYRNTAFLTELLINILVFSVACAALAGVFAKASVAARQTRQENAAYAEVWALLETGKVRGYDQLEGFEQQADGHWACGYDDDWNPTALQGAPYVVRLQVVEEAVPAGTLRRVQARAHTADGRELCSVSTSSYLPKGGGGT